MIKFIGYSFSFPRAHMDDVAGLLADLPPDILAYAEYVAYGPLNRPFEK